MWTQRVCLFCLKPFQSSEEETDKDFSESVIIKGFALFSRNYLGASEGPLSMLKHVVSRTCNGKDLCQDCDNLVISLVELYAELTAVQLKLDWRLKQLNETLKSPDRASSKLRCVLEKNLAKQLHCSSYQVRDIRRHLLKQCSTGKQKQVRIPLEKNSYLDRLQKIKVESTHEDLHSQSLVFDDVSEPSFDWDSSGSGEEDQRRKVKDKSEFIQAGHELDFEEAEVAFSGKNPPVASKLRPRKRKICLSPPRTKVKKSPLKIKVEDIVKTLSCHICIRSVANTQMQLQRHLRRRHENTWKKRNKGKRPPLQCFFCYRSFAFEQSRDTHAQSVNHRYSLTRGKFICNEGSCVNQEHSSMTQLNQHFDSVHGGETVHRCSLCGWPFLNESMREVHQLVHMRVKNNADDSKNFSCPKCTDVWFATYNMLRLHYVAKHTDLSGKLFKCAECGAQFKNNGACHEHMQQHEMDRNLSSGVATRNDYLACEDCDKTFVSRKLLKSHKQLVHELVQCAKCGEAVPTTYLYRHMKQSHKEGDPLPCPQCGKVFYMRYVLQKHIRQVHETSRVKITSRKCHVCQKEYQRIPLLNKHLRDVHQIEVDAMKVTPEYICSECGKGYHYKTSLEQHVDAKHTKESERKWNFKCNVCQRSFWRECLLKSHLAEVHSTGATSIQD